MFLVKWMYSLSEIMKEEQRNTFCGFTSRYLTLEQILGGRGSIQPMVMIVSLKKSLTDIAKIAQCRVWNGSNKSKESTWPRKETSSANNHFFKCFKIQMYLDFILLIGVIVNVVLPEWFFFHSLNILFVPFLIGNRTYIYSFCCSETRLNNEWVMVRFTNQSIYY